MLTAEKIKELLGLEPMSGEGGFYRETYRCREAAAAEALPGRYEGGRSFSTAIYYLITPDSCSRLHRVASDEVFHFHLGDPVTMLQLHPGGRGQTVVIGPDIAAGQSPQIVVPRGVWQGCMLGEGGRFALMGCTVAPGFELADYEHGDRDRLSAEYPAWRELIGKLT